MKEDAGVIDLLAAATARPTASPRVSVVVPTWRRPAMLRRCLRALTMQDLPPTQYEIVVADDGPDDDTKRMVRAMARQHAPRGLVIRYLPVTATQGPAGARNRGWESARGDVVAFTDDDTMPLRNWLSRGLAALEPGVCAVAGRIRVPVPARPSDYELDASGLARAEFATANCFVRRGALLEAGGFDERYRLAWREDSDLQFALLARGGRIARADDAVVLHPVRPAPAGVSIKQQRKVYFDALLYKKYPRLYRERIRARPPWHYFLIVAGACAALAGWALGLAWLAWGGLALWVALTARFCAQRLRWTSRRPAHVAEMIATSMVIPPLSIYWRLRGAWHFRAGFL